MTRQREKPTTNAAERRAVEVVLNGSVRDRHSNRQAAALAGVSHHLVQIVRRERAMER